jgi:type 1 glutamine amidotransferase
VPGLRRTLAFVLLAGLLVGLSSGAAPAAAPVRILFFSANTGERHASIPAALEAFRRLGVQGGFEVDATEDPAAFNDANLPRYAAVAFVLTSGEVLADPQRTELQRYIRAGGGFIGVHSATDTERGWPWYGQLVGAWSSSHPEIQTATLDVVEPRDPSTQDLPARWTRTDQWVNFDQNPRGQVRVLLTIDETTYSPREGAMGADHPMAWSHEFEGGRAWYTALGHTEESYSEPLFLAHLLGGIRWAARLPAVETPVAAESKPAAAARKAPRIVSLKTSVRGNRIAVTVRHANCGRCSAQLEVRSKTTKLRVTTTGASGLTAALPAGRWQVTVVMRDAATGLSATTRRWVRIRL